MRLVYSCVGLIATLTLCSAQVVSTPGNGSETTIRRILDTGISDGHDQKVIGHLGDTAGVLISQILKDKPPTPTNIDMALLVIRSAFADPSFVEATKDKEPRTSLLLLRYFSYCTNDSALKERIAETGKYLQHQYSEYVQRK